MVSTNIGSIGEGIVNDWLKAKGFRTNWDTKGLGGTDIDGVHPDGNRVFVQVKTALLPNKPANVSPGEQKRLRQRAVLHKGEAWIAQITLNSSGRLVGEIGWEKL